MSLARYTAIVFLFLAVSLVLVLAALSAALDHAGRRAVLFSGGLAAVNTIAAYALVRWSSGRSNQAFLVAVLGGMTARMGIMLAAVAVAVLVAGLPQAPLVFSLLGYFAVFLAFELTVLSRRSSPEASVR